MARDLDRRDGRFGSGRDRFEKINHGELLALTDTPSKRS
jgi:hypothetical protein